MEEVEEKRGGSGGLDELFLTNLRLVWRLEQDGRCRRSWWAQ